MDSDRAINPDRLPSPVDDYGQPWSHGRRPRGDPVYVSGQTSVDDDGTVLYERDMAAQFRQSLKNVQCVLDAAGGSMDALVSVTIYVTDMRTWIEDDVSDVRLDYFSEPYPCSTLVEVTNLIDDAMMVEIQAVAYVEE